MQIGARHVEALGHRPATGAALVQIDRVGQRARCVVGARADQHEAAAARLGRAVHGGGQGEAAVGHDPGQAGLGQHLHRGRLLRVGHAIHEQGGRAVLDFVMRGARAAQGARQQPGLCAVIVQVVAVVFLPQAAIDDLGLVLQTLHGQRIAPARAGDDVRGRVGHFQAVRHRRLVQVEQAHRGLARFGQCQKTGGIDALGGVATAAVIAAAAGRHGQQGGQRNGVQGAAMKGESVHGEAPGNGVQNSESENVMK